MMRPRLLAYLQLFRLPNVFTAWSDILMGFLFVHAVHQPLGALLGLVLASSLLYTAGMVLNDVFDLEIDQAERPHRPLPSGRIDVAWASRLGRAMLGMGVLSAVFVSPQAGGVAGILAVAVYLYDGVLKKTIFAPLVMGCCRLLNVLLGMSLAEPLLRTEHWLIAGGLGTYVMGITWFARSEARVSGRALLGFGATLMTIGICLVGAVSWVVPERLVLRAPGVMPPMFVWPACLALISFSLVRRCMIAIHNPEPRLVQQAVKHAILSLVVFDAAIVLAFVGPGYAMLVVALLVPTLTLGRWIYST